MKLLICLSVVLGVMVSSLIGFFLKDMFVLVLLEKEVL